MGYSTHNEFENFEYDKAQLGDIQVTGGIFHLVLDNVMILPENSCNRDIRTMRCNEMLFKLEEPEIAKVVREGYKLYDANGSLKQTVEDESMSEEDYPAVWGVLPGGLVYGLRKAPNGEGKYTYELIVDGTDERTYAIYVDACGETQEWERFLNV